MTGLRLLGEVYGGAVAFWVASCLLGQAWERHQRRKREVIWVAPRYPESERT